MSTFSPGDKVRHKTNGKCNGTVKYLCCFSCVNCNNKNYAICLANIQEKQSVLTEFKDLNGTIIKYRHKCEELELQTLMLVHPMIENHDLVPRELRPIIHAHLDIPLIEFEEEVKSEMEEEDIIATNHTMEQDLVEEINSLFDGEEDATMRAEYLKWLNDNRIPVSEKLTLHQLEVLQSQMGIPI